MREYSQFKGSNPFGSQAKMLLHLRELYSYMDMGDTYPIFIEINLSSRCNLRCKWCISSNFNNKDLLKTRELIKFLKDVYDVGIRAITFSGGGEPTVHPDFVKIVKEARKIGLELGLMTNGTYPSKYNKVIGENFRWTRFSVDIINKRKYKRLKGKDRVDRVLKNLYELRKYPIKVGINCNVSNNLTVEDVEELTKLMPKMADYIQFRPVLPRFFEKEEIEINEPVWKWLKKYRKGKSYVNMSDDKFEDISEGNLMPFNSCEGHFFNPVLDASGNLVVCMHHPDDNRFVFGNIYEKSFKEIWESDKRREVIDFIRSLDYRNECQVCCKLTEVNKLIQFMKNPPKDMDINFI